MALDTLNLISGKDRLQEISVHLEKSHLTYLQLDDSPLKLQARHKLEGFIKEYLCHVPSDRKYIFQETAEILHRSAATVKDFSGYRACTAWSAISLYAANLLAQPWRKEYRTLRTYSGYYKHEIEANLIGAELMFELMGYKHTGLSVLTLEGPIDPDKVSSVSRDAIVAFVECQIMKEIWEGVSKSFTISWLEVLEFRWNSVGTPEQAIRALNFRFHERMLQIREKNCGQSYRNYRHGEPMPMEPQSVALSPSNILPSYQFVPQNNYNTPIMQPNLCNPPDANFYFDPMDPSNLHNRFVNPYSCGVAPAFPRYYPTNQPPTSNLMSSVPGHATRVPTARLIELDTPLPVANYERNLANYERNLATFNEIPSKATKPRGFQQQQDLESDEIDSRRSQSSENERAYYAKVDKRTPSSSKPSRTNNEEKNNDWEFVYKGLESLGYSKDLGERDDVLRKREDARNSSRSLQKTSKSLVNLDHEDKYDKYGKKRSSGLRETNFNEEYSTNGQESRVREIPGVRKKGSLELHDSNLAFGDFSNEKTSCPLTERGPSKKYSNTLPTSRSCSKIVSEASGRSFESSPRDTNRQQSDRRTSEVCRWNCAFCTFLNAFERDICEMCGKSRRKGNEDKPLASGGKECPQCTLVNEKNAATCEACEASLKHSPTYI